MSNNRWHSFATETLLIQEALNQILPFIAVEISERGVFSIVLAGGTTPKSLYQAFCSLDTDWKKWRIFYGDERCYPIDHPDRNSTMANHVWLNHVPIDRNQIHDIPAEQGNEIGAKLYNELLKTEPTFSLVLLGMGEDGHTASLFPRHKIDDTLDVFPVFDAPKAPGNRISLSPHRLSNAQKVFFLVNGQSKQTAVTAWRNNEDLPVKAICPPSGVDIFLTGVSI